ncbi:MAG: hypothetical protein ACOC0U_04110, partial [Desulfovibrionales bacterium]
NFGFSFEDDSALDFQEKTQETDSEDLRIRDYLIKLQKGKQAFSLGYVYSPGTGLLGWENPREGGKFALNLSGVQAEFFHLQDLTGTDKDSHRLSGAVVQRSFFEDQSLYLKAALMAGNDPLAEEDGLAYSLSFQGTPLQEKLSIFGEFSFSGYGNDPSLPDHAWDLGLTGRTAGFQYDFKYSYLGPEFTSPVDPGNENDVEQITASLGKSFSKGHIRLEFERETTNVDQNPTRPVLRSTRLGIESTLSPSDGWPRFFTEAGLKMRESDREPSWYENVREMSRYFSFGFSLSRPKWNITPRYSLSLLDHLGESDQGDLREHKMALQSRFKVVDLMTLRPGFTSIWLLEEGELLEKSLEADLDTTFHLGDDMQAELGLSYYQEDDVWGGDSSGFSMESEYSLRFGEKKNASIGLTGSMTRDLSETREEHMDYSVGLRLEIQPDSSDQSLLSGWLPWN